MKKVFRLRGLDCAVCAAKMERAAGKIDGVNFVSIAYITGRMTLDADAERFDEVLSAVEKACSRIEPDLRIER